MPKVVVPPLRSIATARQRVALNNALASLERVAYLRGVARKYLEEAAAIERQYATPTSATFPNSKMEA